VAYSIKEKIRIKTPRQRDLLRQKLKEARAESGLSQERVARQLGREQSYVTRIEKAKKRRITFIEVEQLAKVYRKNLMFFATLDKVEKNDPSLQVPYDVSPQAVLIDKYARKHHR
jgi:transcriptional regulator with XRE-family HTH domain